MTEHERQPSVRAGEDADPPPDQAVAERAVTLLRSARFGMALVFLVALFVRLVFIAGTPREGVVYDERLYDGLARNVIDGRGYVLDGVETTLPEAYREGPTAVMAPVYPAFLMSVYGTIGRNLTVVRLLQALIGAASCALVYAVVRAWRLGPRSDEAAAWVALVAGLLAAVSRVLVVWTNMILSENLAVPLVLLSALWLLRPPSRHRVVNLLAVALSLGLAVHVRSELVIIVPVAVLWVIAVAPRIRDGDRQGATWRWSDGVWIVLLFALTLVPWTARNWRDLGGFTFVRSFSGPVMYYANNDQLRSTWAMAQGETPVVDPGVADLPPGDELAVDRYLRGLALDYMRAHPDRVVRAAALKAVTFWRPIPDPWRSPGGLLNRVLPGVLAWWLAIVGVVVAFRTPRRSSLVFGFLAVEFLFVAVFGAWERERFRTPIYPFELMLLAAGIVGVTLAAWRLVVEVRRTRRAPAIPARAVAIAGATVILALAFAGLAHRAEPVVAFSALDRVEDLAAWEWLQATEDTVAIDTTDATRGPGSLRLSSRPGGGWQDLQLPLPSGSYDPNALYRVTFAGRTNDAGGGQVYPLIPAPAEGERTVGLERYVFGGTEWREHSHFFVAPFDSDDRLAIYVSHADYQVPDVTVWIDDLTVRRSNWPRYLWEGYVRGSW